MLTIDEAIDRCISLLDDKVPDWRDKINVDKLEMGCPKKCLLGQIFGEYSIGMKKLFRKVLWHDIYQYGLDISPGKSTFTFEQLTIAWKQRLNNE